MAESKPVRDDPRFTTGLTIRFAVRIAIGTGFFLFHAGCSSFSAGRERAVDPSCSPASDFPGVIIGNGVIRADIEKHSLFLAIPDIQGTYTIPYIQSSRTLDVKAKADGSPRTMKKLILSCGSRRMGEQYLSADHPAAVFADLPSGDYTLEVQTLDSRGKTISRSVIDRIGIGLVVCAIGDSITEGYWSRAFQRDIENLSYLVFPAEAVSKDGRNFPQFGPTLSIHHPEKVNCLESWMTDLNDQLSQSLQTPVFIANEGIGGITAEGYWNLMRQDAGWHNRMKLLQPQVWLIHLGVNEERAKVPKEVFAVHLRELVNVLLQTYGARPEQIFLAKPSYDYADGAEEILKDYCLEIDMLAQEMNLSPGPDFFQAYATEKNKWYGDDPVHPNTQGVRYMAKLWHDAVVSVLKQQDQSLSRK